MNKLEIEFKYNAADIKLSDFLAFCTASSSPHTFIDASGWDYFYQSTKDPDAFCRLRVGEGREFNQLTFKRKLNDKNNYIRTEHNIDLKKTVNKGQIDALTAEFGYKYSSQLFKNCFIYKFDWYTFVYYIVYDSDMKEQGRFIEIEMDEDRNWKDEQEAYAELLVLEKLAKPLGISPQSRVRRSLYEMFIKKETP